jgi:hypothetical protein
VVGINEKFWIGSFSQTAGQLGLLFPLMLLSILVPLYLHNGGRLLAILVLASSLAPVINEKRAVYVSRQPFSVLPSWPTHFSGRVRLLW